MGVEAMTQAELFTILESLGMPVAYAEFIGTTETPVPPPPFITYQFAHSGDLMADNQNYVEISNFQIELYTDNKDLAKETLVQNLLKSNRLPYSKTEVWIESEKMRQVVYEIKITGG